MVTLYMSDGNSFAKQQKQFGLFDKYKTVVGNGFATDFQLEAQGDSVLNVVNNLSYHYTMPGARNAEYVKFFEQHVPTAEEACDLVANPSALEGRTWVTQVAHSPVQTPFQRGRHGGGSYR